MPILIGAGVVHAAPVASPPPAWVPIAAGLVFVCGGLAVMLDYGIAGGVGADGDFRPGTPMAVRVLNLVLGLLIVGLMTAIFGWVAFGRGPRAFTTVVSLPFASTRWRSGEMSGRIAFGAATVLMTLMFVACGVSGVRRLLKFKRG